CARLEGDMEAYW
nr:immunoglobulin heavy chain junction region [Mus musculus]